VNGDESRTRLARQVIEHQEMLSAQSVRLLEAFIA